MLKTNRIFTSLLVIFVFFCCAGCGTEQAKAPEEPEKPKKKEMLVSGLIAYKPDDLLILDSDLIITGTVSRIGESKWSNPDFYRGDTIPNYLQTDIYIAIEEILYGEF